MTRQLTTIDLTKEFETPKFGIGNVGEDIYGNKYRFMQANGAKVAKTPYSIHGNTGTSSTSYQIEDIIDTAVTPADGERVPFCVPQIAITDNYFAWVFIGPGDFYCNTADAIAVDAVIYGSTDAGNFSDTASACVLPGVTAAVAIDSGVAGLFRASAELCAEDLA